MSKKDKPSTLKPAKPKDVPYPNHHPAYVLASWFWVGKLRPAAGTWGSLAALPLWWALFMYGNQFIYMSTLITLFFFGALAIEQIEKKIGRGKSHDASVFVIDEVVGMGLTFLPLYIMLDAITLDILPNATIIFLAYGFFTFRLCDVLKPWPIRWIDTKMNNGWGVMLDDVLAGFCAAILLYLGFITWGLTYYAIVDGYIPSTEFWPAFAMLFSMLHIPILATYTIGYGLLWLWRFIQKKTL